MQLSEPRISLNDKPTLVPARERSNANEVLWAADAMEGMPVELAYDYARTIGAVS